MVVEHNQVPLHALLTEYKLCLIINFTFSKNQQFNILPFPSKGCYYKTFF